MNLWDSDENGRSGNVSPLSLFQKEIQTFKCIKCIFLKKNDEIMTGCRGAGNGIIRQSPRVPLPYPDAFAYERCVSLNRNKSDIISGFNSFEIFQKLCHWAM